MRAKTYSVVTNGKKFRLVDDETGNFLMERDKDDYFGREIPVSFDSKAEAEEKAQSISWVRT